MDYYTKYIKYKSKYNNLINNIGGENEISTIPLINPNQLNSSQSIELESIKPNTTLIKPIQTELTKPNTTLIKPIQTEQIKSVKFESITPIQQVAPPPVAPQSKEIITNYELEQQLLIINNEIKSRFNELDIKLNTKLDKIHNNIISKLNVLSSNASINGAIETAKLLNSNKVKQNTKEKRNIIFEKIMEELSEEIKQEAIEETINEMITQTPK